MLFTGTERFPDRAGVDMLERAGMSVGPELNAFTGLDDTTYVMQFPSDDPVLLERGLDLAADWLSAATLAPAAVERERGVVLAELREAAEGPTAVKNSRLAELFFSGSGYLDRDPLADRDAIGSLTADQVRSFYDAWYRPERAAVVVVGDVDPAQVEREIRDRFGGLAGRTPPRPEPQLELDARHGTRIAVVTDPAQTGAALSIVSAWPKLPYARVSDHLSGLSSALVDLMLNARLAESASGPEAPFQWAAAEWSELVRGHNVYAISAEVAKDALPAALQELYGELRRAGEDGFGESELERARVQLLRAYDLGWRTRAESDNGAIAEGIIAHFLAGDPLLPADVDYRLAQRFVPEITLEEVNAAARVLLAAPDRLILAFTSDGPDSASGLEQALASALAEARLAPLEPYLDDAAGLELSVPSMSPAQVVSREELPSLGVTSLRLTNGVRVLMKPTRLATDQVVFTGLSPGGNVMVDDSDYLEATGIGLIVSASGVGNLDASQLEKVLAGKAVSVVPFIDTFDEGFSGGAERQDLETLFQLIYLYATQPRVSEEGLHTYREGVRAALSARASDPYASIQDALSEILCGDSIRCRAEIPEERLDRFDLGRGLDLYRERFADFDDFTFSFVGDFDPAEMELLARRYLGTLPSMPRTDAPAKRVAPPAPVRVDRTVTRKDAGGATVHLTFRGRAEPGEDTDLRLWALERLLDLELTDELRNTRSAAYEVWISSESGTLLDPNYRLDIELSSHPAQAYELSDAVLARIEKLRRVGPSGDVADRVRQQLLQAHAAEREQNSYWLSLLAEQSQQLGSGGGDPRLVGQRIEALDAEALRSAAAALLDPETLISVTLVPTEAPATSSAIARRETKTPGHPGIRNPSVLRTGKEKRPWRDSLTRR
jgi:zinc protease